MFTLYSDFKWAQQGVKTVVLIQFRPTVSSTSQVSTAVHGLGDEHEEMFLVENYGHNKVWVLCGKSVYRL